jgi:hypothetical protein
MDTQSRLELKTEPSNMAVAQDGRVEGAFEKTNAWKPDHRLWMILTSLCVTNILASLENTITVISMPFILRDIGSGENYIWVSNVHFLTG